MAHDVFISYASENKVMADAVCATLESRSIRSWIAPRDVVPGMSYADAIVNALNDCRIVVVLLSSESNASPHVASELERALHNGKPILPVRIEDVLPTGSLEYYLAGKHWLDALTPPMEKHLGKVAEAAGRLLGRDMPRTPEPPPPPPSPPAPTLSGFQASRMFKEAEALRAAAQYDQAVPAYRQLIEAYEALDDKAGAALCANNMAFCLQPDHNPNGSWSEALVGYRKALALREELNDKGEQIIVLGNLGYCLYPVNNPEGDWQATVDAYERKAAVAAEIGDTVSQAKGLVDAGWSTMPTRNPQGDWAKAAELYTRAIPLYEALGDDLNQGIAMHNLAFAQILGQEANLTDETRQAFRRAAEILRRAGDVKTAETAESFANYTGEPDHPVYSQACAAFNAGQWAQAAPLLEQSAELFAAAGNPSRQALCVHNQAWCLEPDRNPAGDWNACAELYRKANELRLPLGEEVNRADTLGNLGCVLMSHANPDRDPAEAAKVLEQAVELKRKTGDKAGEGTALNNLAFANQPDVNPEGNWERAIALYEAAILLREGPGKASSQQNLGYCLDPRNHPAGDWQRAGACYRQASDTYRSVGEVGLAGAALHTAAFLMIQTDGANMTEQTWEMFRLAAQYRRQAGDLEGAKASESWLH